MSNDHGHDFCLAAAQVLGDGERTLAEVALIGSHPGARKDTDARRYQRLQILGAAPGGSPQLTNGTILRFQSLDSYVDRDLERYPARGESDLRPQVAEQGECADLLSPVAADVLALRRQLEVDGFGPERDDGYSRGELADAAASFATTSPHLAGMAWPFRSECNWFGNGHSKRRRNLVKAAALIIAEIERLDRAAIVAESAHG